MNSQSDQQLLQNYAASKSEAAFTELVRRHVDLVYSAAIRMVGDGHLAKDVTQGTFVALAQNAGMLANHPILSGWLHRTTLNLAANIVRSEVRRRVREQEAAAMNELLSTAPDASWEVIAPHLDAALGELSEPDRDAILLRYFEKNSASEMARILGITEEAAQKRVSRAVDRLREFFSKRNVTIGAGGLIALISANAVQSAPAGLIATILATTSGIATTVGMTMIYKILLAGLTATAIGSGIYSFHLQKKIVPLQQQQASLNQQITQLSQERDDAKNRLASLQRENEQLQANENELLKLRGEISRLRRQKNISPTPTQSETNTLPDTETIQILLKSQIASLPTEDLQMLGVGWTSDAQGNKSGVLTEQQFKNISEALRGASDANLISAPRVVTINGETATISVTKALPLFPGGNTGASNGVNYTNIGTSLAVCPDFSTNSSTFTLNLNAKLDQLTGDPSQPNVQTIQITNHAALFPGQTFVFAQEIPAGSWLLGSTNITAEPTSFLMFVTPVVVKDNDFPKPH